MPSTVYILLFRGVGGATQLPVKALRQALTEAGFDSVGTYINSGNAYLKTNLSREAMLAKVAALCADQFGFDKAIYAPSLAEWREVVRHNPFAGKFAEGRVLHAVWLDREPAAQNTAAVKALAVEGEGFEIVGRVGYLHTPGGVSSSQLGMKFDKALGVPNTARNWNTVLKLLQLADGAA